MTNPTWAVKRHDFNLVTKAESRSVGCGYCKAEPGGRCQGKRGDRESSHKERVAHYRSLFR
jgi:hypothetical protein